MCTHRIAAMGGDGIGPEVVEGVSSDWGDCGTGGTIGRVDSRRGEGRCDGYCGWSAAAA